DPRRRGNDSGHPARPEPRPWRAGLRILGDQMMKLDRIHARVPAGAAAAIAIVLLAGVRLPAQASLEKVFADFSDEWVRLSPSQAAASRYFTGEEQDRFEQQITADTPEWRQRRIRLAKRGLDDLRKFDRSRMTGEERVSADLMQWQLDLVVRA